VLELSIGTKWGKTARLGRLNIKTCDGGKRRPMLREDEEEKRNHEGRPQRSSTLERTRLLGKIRCGLLTSVPEEGNKISERTNAGVQEKGDLLVPLDLRRTSKGLSGQHCVIEERGGQKNYRAGGASMRGEARGVSMRTSTQVLPLI